MRDMMGFCWGVKSGLALAAKQVQGRAMLEREHFPIADIRVTAKRLKTLEADKVQQIAEDMLENGQTTPIRVRTEGATYLLVEGLHRLEALKALGEETVDGYLVQGVLR
jgi:ParB-like chromosome segregation protein Spo0J